MKTITLKMTNTNWYSSIESASVNFKSPTGRTVTIQKRFFKWGLIALTPVAHIVRGEVAHTDYDVKVTIDEMNLIFKMSQISAYDKAEELMESLKN